MPKRTTPHTNLHDLTVAERLAHSPGDCQRYWYQFIAQFLKNKTILDVGAATGYGCTILESVAKEVVGVDLLPLSDMVYYGSVNMFEDNSFDVITCIDVIEHVEFDEDFLEAMIRVARESIFITTPNWNKHGCKNQYHVREYTPDELITLLITLDYEIYLADEQRNIRKVENIETSEMSPDIGVFIDVNKI